jgi:hypothetical protein
MPANVAGIIGASEGIRNIKKGFLFSIKPSILAGCNYNKILCFRLKMRFDAHLVQQEVATSCGIFRRF